MNLKRKIFAHVDTETATLPIVHDMNLTNEQKSKVGLNIPLVYDFGYALHDQHNNIYAQNSFLIQGTFDNPRIFNTAYYAGKMPQYMRKLADGEMKLVTWDEALICFLEDCARFNVDTVCAYNAAFDFYKAIPTTERFFNAANGGDLSNFYQKQRYRIECMLGLRESKPYKSKKKKPGHYELRGKAFSIIDTMRTTVEVLLDNSYYKTEAINNGWIAPSGRFFSTNAENSYRYVTNDTGFIESHTALEDCYIESALFCKAKSYKKKINVGIKGNVFSHIGTIAHFLENTPFPRMLTEKGLINLRNRAKTALNKYELDNDSLYNGSSGKMINDYVSIVNNAEKLLQIAH